jgi:hypothetical protein
MSDLYIPRGASRIQVVQSQLFNIDNGAGVTIDDVVLYLSQPIKITAARVVYSGATTGTVAAATVGIGTAVAGVELVAATALENTKTVGTITALTLKAAAAFVAANTMVVVRHTGIAATAAGEYRVLIEYIVLS